jgi:hypothetical protein
MSEVPNYSITGDLCRQMLQAKPALTRSFNSVRCLFGMSWLCEFWANTEPRWRILHGKWSWRCGGNGTHPREIGVRDPRIDRPLGDFLYYTKAQLREAYKKFDFNVKQEPLPVEFDFF